MPNAEKDIFNLMLSVRHRLSRPFEDCFRGEFTSLELNVLCALCAVGPLTATELAAALHIPRQQVSRTAERLYERGCIVRTGCPEDRRKLLISVSAGTAERIRACGKKIALEVCSALGASDEEYVRFLLAAEAVSRALARMPQKTQ